jgi:phage shock protein E
VENAHVFGYSNVLMRMRASRMKPWMLWVALIAIVLVARKVWMMSSSKTAHALVAEGARLVDVRSPAEFAGGHLPGAINIPVDFIEQRAGEIGPKTTPVVVYCASGGRSAYARTVLLKQGFSEVVNLGPMSAW